MNIKRFVAAISFGSLLFISAPAAFAGGTINWAASLTPSRASAPADNTPITIAVHTYAYQCTPIDINNPVTFSTAQNCLDASYGFTGSNLITMPNTPVFFYETGFGTASPSQVTTDASGNASITAKSTSAGSLLINAYASANSSYVVYGSTTVNFTPLPTPVPVAKVVTPTPKPATTPAPVAVATPSPAPVATATPAPVATQTPEAVAPKTQPTHVLSATATAGLGGLVVIVIAAGLAYWVSHRRKSRP